EGYRTPQEVVDGWMNDPPHRANILNCSYKASGVGYFDGAPGNAAGPWWTEDFGFD
ncbi:MAG: CAP domain-containing protein, partial [Actinocrinis sp.]